MIEGYFAEHANQYDALDAQIQKRRQYTAAIDHLVARSLGRSPILNRSNASYLACGTGRRAVDIRDASGLDYTMKGVDMCEEMATQAAERDVDVQVASLRHPQQFVQGPSYDAVTLLVCLWPPAEPGDATPCYRCLL